MCDVDDFIEEVCFSVLASKVLGSRKAWVSNRLFIVGKCIGFEEFSYPTHNIIEICKMSLASLTSKDFIGSQVDVV